MTKGVESRVGSMGRGWWPEFCCELSVLRKMLKLSGPFALNLTKMYFLSYDFIVLLYVSITFDAVCEEELSKNIG